MSFGWTHVLRNAVPGLLRTKPQWQRRSSRSLGKWAAPPRRRGSRYSILPRPRVRTVTCRAARDKLRGSLRAAVAAAAAVGGAGADGGADADADAARSAQEEEAAGKRPPCKQTS